MTLRQTIADDATLVFLDTTEFAETVAYVPYNAPGATVRAKREIAAVVNRQPRVPDDGGDVLTYAFEVHVANDSTNGVASDEINLGRDQIVMPPRDGLAADVRTVVNLLTQDHGMLVLECR